VTTPSTHENTLDQVPPDGPLKASFHELQLALAALCRPAAAPRKPKLVVTIAVAQFRFDSLATRANIPAGFTGG
jgi:hypothetical protein